MATGYGKELLVPLLEEESIESTSEVKDAKNTNTLSIWEKTLAAVYSAFLCWELTGACFYVARVVTCFKNGLLTYYCDGTIPFRHSEKLQFYWLAARSLHIIIVIGVLQTRADLCGYRKIAHQLSILPQFWSLILLLIMALSRYVILSVLSQPAVFHRHLVAAFALSYIFRVAAVAVLNCTRLNVLWHQCPKKVFVFCKLTLLVIFIENFSSFLVSLLQLTLKIEDFHRKEMKDNSNIHLVYSVIYKFGTVSLDFKIMNFFWQKLFCDDKNILSSDHKSLSTRK